MDRLRTLVSPKARHLKWRAFDVLEEILLVLSGLLLLGFILSVMSDVALRTILHPWLTAPEWTLGFFCWGSFLGAAVAVRRDQHFKVATMASSLHGWQRTFLESFIRLVILAVAVGIAIFGYQFFTTGFTTYLQPSTTPIAYLYAAIPVSGVLIALFSIEQLINGWRHGFESEIADNPNILETLASPEDLTTAFEDGRAMPRWPASGE